MLAIRNKEIETLRRISPQETESEEETEERGGKEAPSQKKDREGKELSSSQEKDNEEVKNGEGSSETPSNRTFPTPTEGYPRESIEMAKQLKHRADKEESIELKVQLYLSSIMFFVKSSINQDGTTRSQNGIDHGLKQTLDLARFVKNLTRLVPLWEEKYQKLFLNKITK